VIVCSGDTKPASVSAFLALNIVDFVKKPFRPERLLLDIERALGHAPAAAKRDAAMEVPARIIRGEG
jgi:DNA-binding NtrC family response regulator